MSMMVQEVRSIEASAVEAAASAAVAAAGEAGSGPMWSPEIMSSCGMAAMCSSRFDSWTCVSL